MDISLENLYVDIWAERANFEDSVCSIFCEYFLRFSPCLNRALTFSFFLC